MIGGQQNIGLAFVKAWCRLEVRLDGKRYRSC